MIAALGAPGSLFDVLRSLTSSKSSSATASADPSQDTANSVDSGSPQTQSAVTSGQASRDTISPQTISALIDAQANDTGSGNTNSSTNPIHQLALTLVPLSTANIVPLNLAANLVSDVSFFSFSTGA